MAGYDPLPFARGDYWADDRSSPTTTKGGHLLGREYKVNDTIHSFGGEVTLVAVRNLAGNTIVPNHRFMKFDAGVGGFGRECGGTASVAGSACYAIDDYYKSGSGHRETAIPNGAIFWCVKEGPVYVSCGLTGATAGAAVQTTVNGLAQVGSADDFLPGYADQAFTTYAGESYDKVVVWAQPSFNLDT